MEKMAQIKMTPEELKTKATRYKRGGDQILEILKDLSNLQTELRTEWEGRAFDKFSDQFDQLSPKVKNFAQLLHDIKMQLDNTADAVARHDEELSKNFGLH
ncbi:WXG100 family type VII secretion target [Heyndrickxia sporothermodurans]